MEEEKHTSKERKEDEEPMGEEVRRVEQRWRQGKRCLEELRAGGERGQKSGSRL